jgi:hypothetical protein
VLVSNGPDADPGGPKTYGSGFPTLSVERYNLVRKAQRTDAERSHYHVYNRSGVPYIRTQMDTVRYVLINIIFQKQETLYPM